MHPEHLDEGTAHAWLDGALTADEARWAALHVEACAACAALAAEARGLIAGSSRILLALDDVPGGVVPRERGAGDARGTERAYVEAGGGAPAAAPVAAAPARRGRRRGWLHDGRLRAAAAVLVAALGVTTLRTATSRNATRSAAPAAAVSTSAPVAAVQAPALDARSAEVAGAGARPLDSVSATAPTTAPAAASTTAPTSGFTSAPTPAPATASRIASAPTTDASARDATEGARRFAAVRGAAAGANTAPEAASPPLAARPPALPSVLPPALQPSASNPRFAEPRTMAAADARTATRSPADTLPHAAGRVGRDAPSRETVADAAPVAPAPAARIAAKAAPAAGDTPAAGAALSAGSATACYELRAAPGAPAGLPGRVRIVDAEVIAVPGAETAAVRLASAGDTVRLRVGAAELRVLRDGGRLRGTARANGATGLVELRPIGCDAPE